MGPEDCSKFRTHHSTPESSHGVPAGFIFSRGSLQGELILMSANERAVAQVLSAYNQALNSSDTNAVMPLYAQDGVFMPPYSPSAVGLAEVRKAYDAVLPRSD